MKVSIVTISYNQADFLERCICSVIDQDYDDIEYIVVDPGSTDGSRDIIEKYRERINKIIYEPDDGPADGLNKGFSYATGEVYGFLNSDDVLLPGVLSQVAAFFEEHHQIDIVSGDAQIIDAQDGVIRQSYSDHFSLVRYAYGACVLLQPSTFFRCSAFKKTGGFNIKNRCAWDGELWVDMGLQGMKFRTVRKLWSGFRLHIKSITGSARADDLISEYQTYIFHKIKGLDKTSADHIVGQCFRILRHIFNSRDTIQRILHGPIYGGAQRKKSYRT